MALLTADVPLGGRAGRHVVVDGVAPVAERTRGTREVVRWVERRPPVVLHEVGLPRLVRHVPLRREGVEVAADALEVALLPAGAVNEGDVRRSELHERRIGLAEVRGDCLGVLVRIADDVGHQRRLPPVVDLPVARLARERAGVRCSAFGSSGGIGFGYCADVGDGRQSSDVEHELPRLAIGERPSWHAGVADAVTNQMEDLAVGSLRERIARQSEAGRRIHGRARPRFVPSRRTRDTTGSCACVELASRLGHVVAAVGSALRGVFSCDRARRLRECRGSRGECPRDQCFDRRGRLPGAHAAVDAT